VFNGLVIYVLRSYILIDQDIYQIFDLIIILILLVSYYQLSMVIYLIT